MVPSAFQILEQLPLTPNGKVDRKALPEPNGAGAARETSFVPLQTDVEKRIAVVWQKLLQVEQIGRHDNFFDLGGHSLLVVQAHAQLCEIFQSEFPIIELFQYPTISSLARFLNEEPKEKVSFQKIRDRARRQQGALGMQPRPLKPLGRTTETSSN
jgi:acyl carrier protein